MKRLMWRIMLLVGAVAMAAASMPSCTPSKNTAWTRNYQAFITRYNIYYNGDTHFKETLAEMENNYQDDYSRMLFMHPIDAKTDPKAPQPSGSFNRSIEKAQKAIQIRSIKKRPKRKAGRASDPAYKAWLKREEYNPFLHNAWMMMARSQFYNGDFGSAAATFHYVTKHFKWLDNTVTEAEIWQARCYVELGWLFEAETILRRIKPDRLVNKAIKQTYNYTYANFELRSDSLQQAIPYLQEALKYSSKAQKIRIHFLLGQVYAHLGDKQKAYTEFHNAGKSSGASYRTKFNARIKQSEVYTGQDVEPEVRRLKRMVRYDRNKEYLDQVYYAIGNLYLSRADTAKAIENYRLAVEKSTRGGIEKAIAQITLGNLYFDRHEYVEAQPCYSEGVPLLPETFQDYKMLRKRSDVLDELAIYAQNVKLQDSLLRLADMSEEQRLEVVDGIIKRLKEQEQREAEEMAREQYLAEQQAAGTNLQLGNTSTPNTFVLNSDNSWYFYNQATRNAGRTEFQRRWGSRKLEDDWRRRNKTTFNTSDFTEDTDDDSEQESSQDEEMADSLMLDNGEMVSREEMIEREKRENDPHYPEYYLKQIPSTPEDRVISNDVIQEGLYNMGLILKDKLEDFEAARGEFDRLLARYPDNVYRPEVYYNLYLMYIRENNRIEAEKYRQLMLTEFPETKYGMAMRDPDYIEKLKEMDQRQEELYERTYEDYINNRNSNVHAAYETMMAQYPLSKIMPKFMFLHALAYVTERRPDDFKEVLQDMLRRYPDTDIAPVATAWLKGMNQGRKLNEGVANLRGMIWDTRLSNDSTVLARTDSLTFSLNPESPQMLVLLFPTDKVQSNALLYDVALFNFSSFVVKDFDLEQMNFGRLGMLLVKGFDNQAELDHYRNVMNQSTTFKLPKEVRPIDISVENFDKLLKSGGTFEEYFKFINDESYEITEEETVFGDLPEDEDMEIPTENLVEAEADSIVSQPEESPVILPEAEKPEGLPVVPAPVESPDSLRTEPQTAPPASAPTPARPAKPKPSPVPVPKPKQKPVTPPVPIPEYPSGSEGDDDPLLD